MTIQLANPAAAQRMEELRYRLVMDLFTDNWDRSAAWNELARLESSLTGIPAPRMTPPSPPLYKYWGEYVRIEEQPSDHRLIITALPTLHDETDYLLSKAPILRWPFIIEDATFDSDLEMIRPEEIGALTSNHTLLSSDLQHDEEGEIVWIGRVWYYEPYQVLDPVEELLKKGRITLDATKR